MTNPRAEAAARVGARFDVRVLEPSPPAVNGPPYFADDPVAGGDVLPIIRPGARTWTEVCAEAGDPHLDTWCRDRWLVPRAVPALPAGFGATRRSLHAVAEHVVAPCRHAANGRIGLRFTYHGFGSPFFGADRQVRVEDGDLLDGDRRHRLTTLGAAAEFLGMEAGAPPGVYTPSTPCDADAPLHVDTVAASALGDWFGLCARLLEQVRDEATDADAPSRVQLWPEHFDMAVDLGPEGRRANYGGSPGDDAHPEPYLYVGPWDRSSPRHDGFWNEAFGASLSWAEILGGSDPHAFLRRGKELLES